MKYTFLKNYIGLYSKNKISLIRYWLRDEKIHNILKRHNIETDIFVKKYAISIIDYYIAIVNEKEVIGTCPTIEEFLFYLKDRNITSSEIFIICSGFKNAMIEFSYDLKITNLRIEKEINYIFEQNFADVLELYSGSLHDIKKELTKSIGIVDKYVIISRTDTKGIIQSVSDAFCEISGYKEEELIGQSHSIIRHPDTDNKVFKELWTAIKNGQEWKGELKNKKKNGSFFWVNIVINPSFDSNNNIVFYDAIMENITSKKNLLSHQNILIEQSKAAAMGEMISMIAHQWRQPLQAVSILIQKLPLTKMVEGEISDDLLNHVVDSIGRQLDYMSKTIDDFRDFFLPDKPKEFVSLKELLTKAFDFVSFMIKTDSISINIDANEDVKLNVHANELVQVLINIFKNAKDALLENNIFLKEINIKYYKKDDSAFIEIEDNAQGIPENIIHRIFEPYFSTKSDKNGTGLGLYMSKTIIEKHCLGKLTVSNSSKGAVFKIELPIS
ncbi:MAG: hypothetical protein C0625_08715 [Arcobacter sp.]|nr:MAG: hypothetical protein C0625_08715 [Arcobacter sp.]